MFDMYLIWDIVTVFSDNGEYCIAIVYKSL